MLRVLATPGSSVDVDLQAVARAAVLQAKRQQAASLNTASGGAGSSALAQMLLGNWTYGGCAVVVFSDSLLHSTSSLLESVTHGSRGG